MAALMCVHPARETEIRESHENREQGRDDDDDDGVVVVAHSHDLYDDDDDDKEWRNENPTATRHLTRPDLYTPVL